ncbi:hypothetical protein AB1Y20_001378 [Prymnesium parvum]|uniref:Homoserine dehydrogenase n=1 Tax=Prymnesium parvum TaxID=97485 RepID=A0AB34KCE0_PRYPA
MAARLLLLALSCASAWQMGTAPMGVRRPAASAPAPATMGLRPANIAIVGGGTVGGGIVEILSRKAAFVRGQLNTDITISKVCVRDASKPRDFQLPEGCTITDEIESILSDDSVDTVVEVMGGTTLAKDVILRSLKAGKNVVTANKALIAQDLTLIQKTLDEVNAGREDKVQFRFEAAVCGGIPIIRTLQSDFLGDDVTQISGIINGCTNFILSNMAGGGLTYADALKEASALGYAEADPTLDVGGFDARSKLRILMKLAFGIDVDEDEIPCRGITEVTSTDFEYAKLLVGTVKLLGVAKLDKGGKKISAFVSPCFVPTQNTLSSISGATNAVQVSSTSLQQSVFVGQGAGRYPTANSCVSDILAICQGQTSVPFPKEASNLQFVNSFESAFYIRIRFRDRVGITFDLGQIFSDCGVSIYSMLQNPIKDRDDAMFVVTTDPVDVTNVKTACVKLEATDWCIGEIFYMPVL